MNDFVQVEPVEEKEQKRGKVIVADTGQRKVGRAVIVSIGPGSRRESAESQGNKVLPFGIQNLKVGDTVLFNPNLLHEVQDGDETLYFITSTAIYATTTN